VSSRRRQKQIREFALALRQHGPQSEDILTAILHDRAAPTINEVAEMLRRHALSRQDANMLQHLLETLMSASRTEERDDEKIRVMLREQEARRTMIEHKRIMSTLTETHLQGPIIGRTKVMESKSPPSNIQRATKRKRRP
jgi:hypothetical protein